MKQTKLWLVTIAVLLCSITASAYDFEMNGIYYNIISSKDKTVEVTYSDSEKYSGAITIPKTIGYQWQTYSVTEIGDKAFSGCSSLTSITIPESVTEIGDKAFTLCSSLSAVHISSLEAWCKISFGDNPLSYAHNLYLNEELITELVIPDDVTEIGDNAFSGCSSLTAITIPEGVTSIGESAFDGCSGLTSITIPEGVTSIGYAVFSGCSSLITINVAKGNTMYDSREGCNAIIETNTNTLLQGCSATIIPKSIVRIGEKAFRDCDSLTSITIPKSVTSIGNYAFSGCNSLTSIILPDGLTEIGQSAFSACGRLTSITIPEGVTSIGFYAFYGCSSLYKVINKSNLTLSIGSSSNGYVAYYAKVVYQKGEFTTAGNFHFYTSNDIHFLVDYIGNDTEIVLPDDYNGEDYRIGDCAFYGFGLTSIILPENVSSIGNYAFYDCSRLTSITISKGVTNIENEAFHGCSSLYKVINKSNLALSIGSSSNGYVAYYAKVVYQEGEFTTAGNFHFYTSNGIHSLVNYIGNDTDIVLPNDCNGENYKIGDYAFYGCNYLATVNIPESVISIGDEAFKGCTALKKVVFKNSCTILELGHNDSGQGLFYDCPLEEVYLGRNLSYNVGSSYGYSPFYNKDALTKVTISSEVTEINQYAFYGCSCLNAITIPESVISIGNNVFDDCTALKKVILENSSTILELGYNGSSQGLFYDCPLEEVYLGRNLSYNVGSSYGYSPFYNKDALTKVAIGNEVTEINQYAFYGCDNIYSLTIPNGILTIGSSAFSTPDKVIWLTNTPPTGYTNAKGNINYVANNQYTDLSNVQVYPYLSSMFEVDGVKYVPVSPSERTCHAIDCVYDETIETISIGETALFKGIAMKVTEAMPYTFYGNKHIKEVSVSHLGNIGDYAFYDCDDLKSVVASNSGSIGERAFYGCNALRTAVLGNKVTLLGNDAFRECTSLAGIVIPDSVRSIGSYCFWGCSALTNFSLGCSVATINNYVFQDCSSLSKIILPPTVTKVGDYVFAGCSKLADVIIADRSTALHLGSNGSSALFADCPLDSVYIGGKITYNTTSSKGYSPFYHNTSLRTIVVSDCEEQIYDNEFYGCTNLQNVTIGNGAKSIGNGAFRECTRLEEIVIPDSVKSVGSYCFYGCTAMKNVVIGDRLTDVKEYAFANCSGLESVRIGSGVTSISNHSFKDCSSISKIILPQSVTKVGDYVFSGCSLLANVIIADRTTALNLGSNGSSALFADCPLDSVYIGGKITYNTTSSKGYSPFYRNTSLRTVVITDREEQIYDNEFYGCTNLQDVTIGNGVKSIGDYAFSGCSSLEGFAFGSNMESIGAEAFSDCTGLTTITSHATVPPTCGAQALDDINKWSCTLRVPSGYAATYQAADQWKDFFFIEDAVEVAKYTLTFMVDGEVYHTESLAHKAEVTIPEVPTKEGHTFSGWSEVPETMPAEDVTINGFFTVNKYLVTFKIGDEVISSESLEYGATIVVPEAPEREGYTFDGWGEVAETVPAGDVTYEGTYTVNVYKVYYYVGEELVHTAEVAYGESIPEYVYETTVEGDEFVGWIGETYETMPAHDVTYTANITNDISRSTMDDSQLTIYDLNGRKIEVDDLRELAKGVYIVNGRLVVIK